VLSTRNHRVQADSGFCRDEGFCSVFLNPKSEIRVSYD
jgi:hypothetical protein